MQSCLCQNTFTNVGFQFSAIYIYLVPVDSSESSGESVSGFSSSGYSFQSVIGREHEAHSLEVSDTGLGNPCPHKIEDHQQYKDKSSKLQNQKRNQPLKVKKKKKKLS